MDGELASEPVVALESLSPMMGDGLTSQDT